jgi:hypothetical protein
LSPFCGSVTCGSSPYIRPIEHALNRGQFHPFKAPHVPRPRNAATSNDLSIDNSHSQHRGGGIASLYILSACPVPVPRTTSVRRAALHPALQLPRFEITALRRRRNQKLEHGPIQAPHAISGTIYRLGTLCERRCCTRRTRNGEDCRRRSHERRPNRMWFAYLLGRTEVLTRLGLDTMDSYSADDAVLWHHLPDWNGPWGSSLF